MASIFECTCECDSEEDTEASDTEDRATDYESLIRDDSEQKLIKEHYKFVITKLHKIFKWRPMRKGLAYESVHRL